MKPYALACKRCRVVVDRRACDLEPSHQLAELGDADAWHNYVAALPDQVRDPRRFMALSVSVRALGFITLTLFLAAMFMVLLLLEGVPRFWFAVTLAISGVFGALLMIAELPRRRFRTIEMPGPDSAWRLSGTIRATTELGDAPASNAPCVGYGLLVAPTSGRRQLLMDAASFGFEVEDEQGARVQVPPGRLRLSAAYARAAGRGQAEELMKVSGVSGLSGVHVWELRLVPGMRVELASATRPTPSGATYRDAAAPVLTLTGTPMIHVLHGAKVG